LQGPEPDPLLPSTVWLLTVLPPPRFPISTADTAFPAEELGVSTIKAAHSAFGPLEKWGYLAIGRHEERANELDVLGYSSEAATIWVVFFGRSLSVLVTGRPETDPSRLNHHLAASGRGKVAVWGAFPLEARHLAAAANRFLEISDPILRDGNPDLAALAGLLEADAASLASRASRSAEWQFAQELARGGRHRAAVRRLQYSENDLPPEQRAFLEQERKNALSEPPALERGGRSDRDWFVARAEYITAKDSELKHLAKKRDESPADMTAFRLAAADYHEAQHLLYDDLEERLLEAKEGDQAAVAYLVAFIEADVWCFRSGYMKGRVYEVLRQVELDEPMKARVGSLLLRLVDVGYRLEFRSACRLARQIDGRQLIAELKERLHLSHDVHVRRRALWMLCYLPIGLQEQDRQAVLDVLFDTAHDDDWYRVNGWIYPLCRRFADEDFARKIQGLALSSDELDARVGLRLLPITVRGPLNSAEKSQLAGIVLEAVHDRGPGAHLMESLAPLADSRRLRASLDELAKTAQTPVNRYARWALNSAVRVNGKEPPEP
jgi:hypothetical protein